MKMKMKLDKSINIDSELFNFCGLCTCFNYTDANLGEEGYFSNYLSGFGNLDENCYYGKLKEFGGIPYPFIDDKHIDSFQFFLPARFVKNKNE